MTTVITLKRPYSAILTLADSNESGLLKLPLDILRYIIPYLDREAQLSSRLTCHRLCLLIPLNKLAAASHAGYRWPAQPVQSADSSGNEWSS